MLFAMTASALYAKAIANAIASAIIRPTATATPLTTLQAASSLWDML
jgi:hypothetical protein